MVMVFKHNSNSYRRKELHTSKSGGTTGDPITLLARQKGSKSIEKSNGGQGEGKGNWPEGVEFPLGP